MKTKEKINVHFGLGIRNTAEKIGEFLIGTVFSCSGMGGMFPFGIAYTYSTGLFGVIGVIIGCLIRGGDVIRYCSAAVLNYTAKTFLSNSLHIKKEYSAFLFTLWSVMGAGIVGLFIDKTNFTENCLFMICAPVSAVFAYIFSVTRSNLEGEKKLTAQIRFIFLCISFSSLLPGLISIGTAMKYVSAVTVFTVLFCISGKCAVYVSATVAAIIGTTFFICDTSQFHILFTLLFGAIGSGLLKSFGKYPVILAYIASCSLESVIFNSKNFLPTLICLIISGTVYSILPQAVTGKISKFITADLRIPKKTIIKKKNTFRAKISDSTQEICNKCSMKYNCWVKNYSKTTENFNKIQNNGFIPEYFRENCIKSDEIAKILIKKEAKNMKAIHASASVPKKGESVCGDTCTVFRGYNGQIIFCIADGMGSGEEAGKESVKISVMIKKLMSDGLDKNDTLRLINDSLLRSGKETVMGIDILIIDEINERCEFIKAGAAQSFIVREGTVFEIGSSSTPIGMLENVSLNKTRCSLKNRDFIIMLSDGFICDRLSGIISESIDENPVDFAKNLIKRAKENRLTEKDDVSVIAVYMESTD